jgi:hypothetical protein
MEREGRDMTYTLDDPNEIEDLLRRAKVAARAHKYSVQVVAPGGEPLAVVFPDGHIDATWAGSRVVSIVESEGTRAQR